MRFSTTSALCFGVGLLSCVSSSAARATYQRHARTTTDVCANVDAGLKVNLLGIVVTVGVVDVCLCISGIPDFLKVDAVAKTAVGIAGVAAVTAQLEAMINSAADHKTCSYPDNCTPVCSSGSPCGFNCKNGFVPYPSDHPTECICPAPKKVCNGVCGSFPSCPSAGPKKRDSIDRSGSCGAGLTACGVYGWQGVGSEAWECIDTKRDLESCGGCMVPFGRNIASGVDCTAIPGVMDVTCNSGSCVVHRCQPGYIVSLDNSYCLDGEKLARIQAGDVPAAVYGLEHVPLHKKSD